MKKTIIYLVIILVVLIGLYFIIFNKSEAPTVEPGDNATNTELIATSTIPATSTPNSPANIEDVDDNSTTDKNQAQNSTIGKSVNGKEIQSITFGSGEKEILVIGGIHGDFSPSTIKLVEYLANSFADAKTAPSYNDSDYKIVFIPNLNPDATGSARTNANKVDLNRNFGCDWKADAEWTGGKVSGGTASFSEPEAKALRDYITNHEVVAVVNYFAEQAGGAVYADSCQGKFATQTKSLTSTYAAAAGYSSNDTYVSSKNTGEIGAWLATENIPAIDIMLPSKTTINGSKDLAGLQAVIDYLE